MRVHRKFLRENISQFYEAPRLHGNIRKGVPHSPLPRVAFACFCTLVICSTKCLRGLMVSDSYRRLMSRLIVSCSLSSRGEIASVTNKEALELSKRNSRTCVRLLRSCTSINDVLLGEQFHSITVKSGLDSDVYVSSALVNMYSKCHFVEEAREVFDKMTYKDLVSWNVMMSCYSLNDLGRECFRLFESMRTEGLMGDGFTFSSFLNSCGSLNCHESGRQAHCMVVKLALDSDVVVGSSLVDMYFKCGSAQDARQVFDFMVERNVICWNTTIVGYGKHGEGKEALRLFSNMLRGGLRPDELTIASILSCCGNLASTNEAIQIHGYVEKIGFRGFLSIGNSLIVAYAKCGSIDNATRAFSLTSTPDLVTWSSMIYSYAFHGLAMEAINMFEEMLSKGIGPDGVAILGVLSACSHAGLVDAGLSYFDTMKSDYQIKPSSEHYACLVDLLGRAGHLDQAYHVIQAMPFEADANVLGAFIGGCKMHQRTELAVWAAEKLFSLEPNKSVNYTLLSNIYVGESSWKDVLSTRRRMKHTCGIKVPGCSWIEIGGTVHTFVSYDRSHMQTQEIYNMLEVTIWLMRNESNIDNMCMDEEPCF